jgi:hypothetical protein
MSRTAVTPWSQTSALCKFSIIKHYAKNGKKDAIFSKLPMIAHSASVGRFSWFADSGCRWRPWSGHSVTDRQPAEAAAFL